MQNSDEMKIYEETGCLFSCEKFAYELRPKGTLERDNYLFRALFPELQDVSDILQIGFNFGSGDYMEFEQVMLDSTSILTTRQSNCQSLLSTRYTT